MTLVNWTPFRDLEDVFDRYNRLFSRMQPAAAQGEGAEVAQWRPVANIAETNDEYLIKAELPEVDKKDVEVTVHEGVITIRGERRYERSDDSEKQHRVESFYGSFARSFSQLFAAGRCGRDEDLRRVQGWRAQGAHPEDAGGQAEGHRDQGQVTPDAARRGSGSTPAGAARFAPAGGPA